MTQQSAGPARRVLTFFVTLAVLLASIAGLGQSARAAGTPTSIGLAEHGLMAYRDYQPGATPEARIPEEMIENALN